MHVTVTFLTFGSYIIKQCFYSIFVAKPKLLDDDLSSNEVSLRSTTRLAKQIPECAEIIYGSTDSIKKLFDSVSQDNSSTAQLTGYRLRQKRSRPESPTTDSSSESQSSSVMTLENKHAKQSRQEIGNSSTSNGKPYD